MVMISPQHEGFYGSIERVGNGSVQTLFHHFLGLPVFPQDTYWVEGGTFTRLENLKLVSLGRSWPSIVAGYLRGWALMGSIYVVCIGVGLWFMPPPQIPGDPMPLGHSIVVPIVVALGLCGLPLAALVWFFTRRPIEGDEAARRAIYQTFFGLPVDPALLHGDVSFSLEGGRLLGTFVDLAYKNGLGRHEDIRARWEEAALDARMARPDLLRVSLTCARFQQGKADTATRTRLRALEAQLWDRLTQVDPSVRGLRPTTT